MVLRFVGCQRTKTSPLCTGRYLCDFELIIVRIIFCLLFHAIIRIWYFNNVTPCLNMWLHVLWIINPSLKRQSQLQQTTFIIFFHHFSEKIRLDVSSEAEDSHEKSSHIFFKR